MSRVLYNSYMNAGPLSKVEAERTKQEAVKGAEDSRRRPRHLSLREQAQLGLTKETASMAQWSLDGCRGEAFTRETGARASRACSPVSHSGGWSKSPSVGLGNSSSWVLAAPSGSTLS